MMLMVMVNRPGRRRRDGTIHHEQRGAGVWLLIVRLARSFYFWVSFIWFVWIRNIKKDRQIDRQKERERREKEEKRRRGKVRAKRQLNMEQHIDPDINMIISLFLFLFYFSLHADADDGQDRMDRQLGP